MKAANIWSIGLDERGSMNYDEFDFTGDCVLVLGREGAGLHDLVRKTCDYLPKDSDGRRRLLAGMFQRPARWFFMRRRGSGGARHEMAARRVQGKVQLLGAPVKKQKGLGS